MHNSVFTKHPLDEWFPRYDILVLFSFITNASEFHVWNWLSLISYRKQQNLIHPKKACKWIGGMPSSIAHDFKQMKYVYPHVVAKQHVFFLMKIKQKIQNIYVHVLPGCFLCLCKQPTKEPECEAGHTEANPPVSMQACCFPHKTPSRHQKIY